MASAEPPRYRLRRPLALTWRAHGVLQLGLDPPGLVLDGVPPGTDQAAAALADAELEAANADGDVEPMDPEDIIDATRNDEVRDILAAANQTMADQLKTETDQLLDTVLYTVSMKMKNGFNRSDN